MKLSVKLTKDIELDFPIYNASGTFQYGEYQWCDVRVLDLPMLTLKTSKIMSMQTKEDKANLVNVDIPNKSDITTMSIINSVALQNPEIHEVAAEIRRLRKKYPNTKMVASISAYSVEEFVENARILEKEDIAGIEVNLSCPNIKAGSNEKIRNFATDPEAIYDVFKAIKKITNLPLFAKISPNIDDITKIAIAAEKGGADVIIATNSYVGYKIDPIEGKPIISKGMGGYSSPLLFPLTLRSVFLISKVVKIPVIAVGGVATAQNVIDALSVGASAVQIGTAIKFDPNIFKRLKKEVAEKLEKLGIDDINKIIGRSHKYKIEELFPITHSFVPKRWKEK